VNDLSDLSVIMMTANRPRMFRDVIDQYAATAPGIKIHAADYGAADAQRQNAEAAARHPEMVRHYVFPPQTPWQERFNQLINECDTTYVVLAADDDVLIPDGLRESVTFLQAHPDYSACHGIYYAMWLAPAEGQLGVGISCGFTGRAYESPDPVSRLMSMMYWYQSVYYAVQRRDQIERIVMPREVHSGAMVELFTACVTLISGKVARLRSPYCLRNAVPTEVGGRLTEFCDVIMTGGERFLEEYIPVRNKLAELLREHGGIQRDFPRLIDVAFASHIRKNWREAWVFSKLAAAGDIPLEDLAELGAPGIEQEAMPIPTDYLGQFIQPLAVRGWPRFG
jgi:glycosyltransferase domain-containing protein